MNYEHQWFAPEDVNPGFDVALDYSFGGDTIDHDQQVPSASDINWDYIPNFGEYSNLTVGTIVSLVSRKVL